MLEHIGDLIFNEKYKGLDVKEMSSKQWDIHQKEADKK